MNAFLNEEMLRLHHLIRTKSTGTPQQLAKKLGCSQSTLYEKIKQLKDIGLPIVYCQARQGYEYACEVAVNFQLIIDGETLKQITGGAGLLTNDYQNNFATPKKPE